MDRRRVRAIPTDFQTREEDGSRILEGYFAVFDSDYEIGPGMTEAWRPERSRIHWPAGISAPW